MTPKKWYKRAAAMLTAFALMFVLIPFGGGANVNAADEKAVTLTNVTLLLNGKEVTDSTKVNNGDEVFFAFDWAVDKSADEVLVNPLIADIDFKGIYLLATDGPLQQGNVDRGTYKIIKTPGGNKIEFYVEEDQLKQSNIKGQAVFKGNISYTANDIGEDGKFDIKAVAQGKPILSLRPEATVSANAWISKQTDGQLYKGADGSYYQNYTVTVNANSSSTGKYTITSLTDTPVDPAKSSVSGSITASATGNVSGLSSSYSSFSAVKGVVLSPGASVTFKYSMKVDKSVITDRYNTWSYGNRAVLNNTLESSASPNVPEILVPNVSKSGRLDSANHKIIWTLEIGYMDFTGNPGQDRAKVASMEDIPYADPATGEMLTVSGSAFSASEFWSKAKPEKVTVWGQNGQQEQRWRYTYTYETEYEDNGVSVDRVFRNDFNVNIDGFEYNRPAYVTVPGGANPVDKRFDGTDENGDLNWTIVFTTPSAGQINDVVITDVLGADYGLSHEIVPGSIEVNGAGYSLSGNVITITDRLTAGQVVTVTLKTRRTDDKKSAGRYYNTAKAVYVQTVNGNDIDVEREDTDQYEVRNIVSKSADGNIPGNSGGKLTGENKAGWCVSLDLSKLSGVTPKAGDTVVLKDSAVMRNNEGQSINIGGIYKIQVGGNMWWTPNANSVVTDSYLSNGTVALSGNEITVTLTDEIIREKSLYIFYYQEVSNPAELDGNYQIGNTVSVTYNGKDAGSAYADQWKGFTKEEILKKDSDGKGNLVHYTVEVNKPGIKMGGDEDSIYMDDVMGELLRFQEGTLTVTDGEGNPLPEELWSYTYDSSARKLSVVLPDETHCLVKYDAIIDVEIRNLGGKNGYFIGGVQVELSSIYDEITNTASLSGAGGYSSSKSDTWSEADVTGEATIISDTGDLVVDKYDSLTGLHLNGAEFSLVPGKFTKGAFVPYVNDGAHPSFKETINYDTGNEADTLIENLEFGILYELTETNAPAEHRVFDGERYIVIRKPGDSEPTEETIGVIPSGKTVEFYVAGETIRISNDPIDSELPVVTTVSLSKREVGSSAELPGARIRVEKLTGNAYMMSSTVTVTGGMTDVVRTPDTISFTSGGSPAVITGLPAGSYRMVEDAAPAGYKKTSAITFNVRVRSDGTYSITSGGKVLKDDTVVMEDELIAMSISKQDVFGSELPGARLTLTGRYNDGRAVDFAALGSIITSSNTITTTTDSISFVSTNVPTTISGLPEGNYVLHEEAAPAGYLVAQDISFAVDAGGNVILPTGGAAADNKLIMTDERTYVVIKKTDIALQSGVGDAPQIPGARLEISGVTAGLDFSSVKVYNGKNVTVTGNGVEFTTTSHEAEIRGLPTGRYVLTETIAPEGYEAVKTSFTFAVNENGTVAGAGSDDEYRYDPVFHRITMMDKIEEVTVDEDVTLGMSGLPISKVAMTDGIPQLEGAVLTIKADNSNNSGGDVANATVMYRGSDSVIASDGVSLTFTTGSDLAFVSGLTVGDYVLTEDAAPAGFDKTTDFYFRVILVDKTYSVVPGKNNGYNVIRSDGTVVIRDYPEGVKEDPEEPEKEPETSPTQTVSVTETTTGNQTYANIETTPTVTYPRRPSYTGPYTGTTTGRIGPGYFDDPSITEHIDRNKPTEPLESEDIKAGSYAVEQDEGGSADSAAVVVSAAALMASAVYAAVRGLKRRRSK